MNSEDNAQAPNEGLSRHRSAALWRMVSHAHARWRRAGLALLNASRDLLAPGRPGNEGRDAGVGALAHAPVAPQRSVEEQTIAAMATADANRPIVIYHSHNLKWHGAPNSLVEIATGVGRRTTFAPVLITNTGGALADICRRRDIAVIDLGRPARLRTAEECETQLDELRRLYSRLNPAVVHGNTLRCWWAVIAARKLGIPAVWNIREGEDPNTCFDYLPERFRAAAYDCFRLASCVVFVAEATRQLWAPFLGPSNHAVIATGVDFSRLTGEADAINRDNVRRSLGLAPDDILLLTIGTVSERKGQLDLAQALFRLPDGIRQKLVVAVIGFTTNPYSKEVRKQLRAYEAGGGRVHALKETRSEGENTVVAQYYVAANMFVLCSRHESYPRVILEAMAFGLPIVSTPVFGIPEQVIEGQSGVFYQPGDAGKLAEHIGALCSDAELRRKLGRGARLRLEAMNSYDRMLNSYEELYRKLLA
jgi:glycosyltransferase involved in cell wall biosynthesis